MAHLKSILTFSGLTMVSRVLGFIRDILLANYIGAGRAADVFIVAFKLPNFFRRLFAEGAFNAAFVPLYSRILGLDPGEVERQAAQRFAEEALAVLLTVLLVFTALFQLAMPWFMQVLAPGFVGQPAKFDLAVEFTRATFPYLMLVSLVSLVSGILNSLRRFAAAAAAPILLNLTLIGSLLLFHQNELVSARWLARAVTVGGAIQLVWILWAARRAGVGLRLQRPRLTRRVRELGRLMLPAALGAGAVQVNLVIDIIIGSLLPVGSLSYLFYADRLNQLPIGVVGVAVGTVLLPNLARALEGGDKARALKEQNRALETALLMVLPAALALVVIGEPIIRTLFERGSFEVLATGQTARALSAYALGLPAYVLIKGLTPGFHARKDTRTPVKIALVSLFINTSLNLILMGPLGHVGLALATAIAAWVNALSLYFALRRRDYFRADRRLISRGLRAFLASLLMGAALWYLAPLLVPGSGSTTLAMASGLAGLIVAGMAIYAVLALVSGAATSEQIKRLFKRPVT